MSTEEAEKLNGTGGVSIIDRLDKSVVDGVPTIAKLNMILENQAIILAALTGKSKQDVEEETTERYQQHLDKAKSDFWEWAATMAQ